MTHTDTTELERLLAAATPSPWESDADDDPGPVTIGSPSAKVGVAEWLHKKDAALIVALVNAAPALIAELKELRANAPSQSLDVVRAVLDETARERNALLAEVQAARAVVEAAREDCELFGWGIADPLGGAIAAYDAAVAGKAGGE